MGDETQGAPERPEPAVQTNQRVLQPSPPTDEQLRRLQSPNPDRQHGFMSGPDEMQRAIADAINKDETGNIQGACKELARLTFGSQYPHLQGDDPAAPLFNDVNNALAKCQERTPGS